MVTLRFWFPDDWRKRDPDNFIAGSKFVIDGLVKAGVIAGDDFDSIRLVPEKGGVDPDHPRLEVEVRRLA